MYYSIISIIPNLPFMSKIIEKAVTNHLNNCFAVRSWCSTQYRGCACEGVQSHPYTVNANSGSTTVLILLDLSSAQLIQIKTSIRLKI